jgi:hypothetical protein
MARHGGDAHLKRGGARAQRHVRDGEEGEDGRHGAARQEIFAYVPLSKVSFPLTPFPNWASLKFHCQT